VATDSRFADSRFTIRYSRFGRWPFASESCFSRRSAYHRSSSRRRSTTSAKRGEARPQSDQARFVKDEEITALLSKQYGVPSISLEKFEIDPAVIKLVPGRDGAALPDHPLSRSGATLTIAMTDPTNVFAMDDIKFMTGYNVEPVVASETAVSRRSTSTTGQAVAAHQPASALEVATRALEEMPSVARTDDVEVINELEEISVEAAREAGRGSAGHQAGATSS
jgi:hypothetical protein